ncbi:MAG: hypothetical protein AAF702_31535 [Chloroflexota bacterium]
MLVTLQACPQEAGDVAYRLTDYRLTDYRLTDYRLTDYRLTDYWLTDLPITDLPISLKPHVDLTTFDDYGDQCRSPIVL